MTESKYTKSYVSLPTEMMERAKNAEGYSGAAEYIRVIASAGESNIADLDPRTLNNSGGENSSKRGDLDKIIFEALDDDYAKLDDILDNGLQDQIADHLLDLAQQDDSPIEKSGLKFKIDE